MLKRVHYPEEFKRKLGLELASGMITAGEMSKREGISANTLYKWRDMVQGIVVTPDEKEILEMRKRLKELEEIVSDQALTIHILKKLKK